MPRRRVDAHRPRSPAKGIPFTRPCLLVSCRIGDGFPSQRRWSGTTGGCATGSSWTGEGGNPKTENIYIPVPEGQRPPDRQQPGDHTYAEAVILQKLPVVGRLMRGAVPDIAAAVAPVDEIFEMAAVMGRGGRDLCRSDEAVQPASVSFCRAL